MKPAPITPIASTLPRPLADGALPMCPCPGLERVVDELLVDQRFGADELLERLLLRGLDRSDRLDRHHADEDEDDDRRGARVAVAVVFVDMKGEVKREGSSRMS